MEEEKIIRNIIQIRSSQGITKRTMADALCMNEANYGRIENGKIALSYRMLAQIASVLKLSVIDIITFPDKYKQVDATKPQNEDQTEVLIQLKLKKEKKEQVLKLVFGENDIEILNR